MRPLLEMLVSLVYQHSLLPLGLPGTNGRICAAQTQSTLCDHTQTQHPIVL